MRSIIRIIAFVCLLLPLIVNAQDEVKLSGKDQDAFNDAEFLFEQTNYLRALKIYDSLRVAYPEYPYLDYQTALCLINKIDGRKKAFDILLGLDGNERFPDVKFHMARAKHLLYEFDEAIGLYSTYLDKGNPTGKQRILTNHYLKNCKTGKEIMERRISMQLAILGPPSTKTNSQYSPVISADGNRLYYTNRGSESKGDLMLNTGKKKDIGDYYEDVFVSERQEDDTWSDGASLSSDINTVEHEAPTGVSFDGKKLFVYRSGKSHKEDIYMSELMDNGAWTVPKELKGSINSVHWEGSATMTADGKTIYFASDRPGGLGGRDIYTAQLQDDGTWGDIENMGPRINTEFNDDSPFIYVTSNALYFASEGHNSIGGYDIFYTSRDSAGDEWDEPVNIGYPINTTDDDRYYVVSSDGKQGFFSSARASGENLHDIYVVEPGAFEQMTKMVLLVGQVFMDDKPTLAMIEISDAKTGKIIDTIYSNPETGEFQYSLLPGNRYKLTMIVEGNEPHIEYIDIAESTNTFVKVDHKFRVYSFEYAQLGGKKDGISLQDDVDGALADRSVRLFGEVYLNNKPVGAQIQVRSTIDNKLVAVLKSDSVTGKFEFALLPGSKYQLKFIAEGAEPYIEYVDVLDNGLPSIIIDHKFYLYTFDYTGLRYDKTGLTLQEAIDGKLQALAMVKKAAKTAVKADPRRDTLTADEIAAGLAFRVQVGAYRNPGRFNYDFLRDLGSVEIKGYPDGITRYLMGPKFTTRTEANVLRQKCIEAGQTDAWITIR